MNDCSIENCVCRQLEIISLLIDSSGDVFSKQLDNYTSDTLFTHTLDKYSIWNILYRQRSEKYAAAVVWVASGDTDNFYPHCENVITEVPCNSHEFKLLL